jgi:hypothetical protein
MLVETLLSLLTVVCYFKPMSHRGWTYFETRLAFTMALLTFSFNGLVLSLMSMVSSIYLLLISVSKTSTTSYLYKQEF